MTSSAFKEILLRPEEEKALMDASHKLLLGFSERVLSFFLQHGEGWSTVEPCKVLTWEAAVLK